MKTTKLLVFSGALAQESAGDTLSPPHMRMGSSAACFLVSIPPSLNVGELTVTDASGAVIERVPLVALSAVPAGGLWTRAWDSVSLMFH